MPKRIRSTLASRGGNWLNTPCTVSRSDSRVAESSGLSAMAFSVRERLRYHHAVWHTCVLAGSAFHHFAVLFYVIPGAPCRVRSSTGPFGPLDSSQGITGS